MGAQLVRQNGNKLVPEEWIGKMLSETQTDANWFSNMLTKQEQHGCKMLGNWIEFENKLDWKEHLHKRPEESRMILCTQNLTMCIIVHVYHVSVLNNLQCL